MLPLVARSTIEVLGLVPDSLREASYALGVSKWRTVLFVVMPSAIGSIMTGATLAIARAAGETAPLLFTTSIFLPNQVVTEPEPRDGCGPAPDPLRLRVAGPEPERPGVGGGVRPDDLRARPRA